MPFENDEIPIENFMGTFDRGRDDVVPPNHFIDSLNVKFRPRTASSREGTVPSILDGVQVSVATGRKVVRHYFKRADGYGVILMWLEDDGKLYGRRNGITSLLLDIPTMTDFAIYSTQNRVYISPHDGDAGLAGQKIYYWDGTNVRSAAGARPTAATPMVATTAGTGVNEVQTLTLTGVASAGNFSLYLPNLNEFTIPLPFNFSAAQLESALRGDNERQSVWLINASGGTFILSYAGIDSAAIPYNATAAQVKTALEGISAIGVGNIDVLSGDGSAIDPWLILFIGTLAKQDQALLTINGVALTGTAVEAHVDETLKGRTLLGVGNVTVTGVGPWVITYIGEEGEKDQPLPIIDNNLSGVSPVLTIVETTAGVPAGKIDYGKHLFAVAYETESGFITGPGPLIAGVFTPTNYDAPLAPHKVNITNVPLGPTGITRRHLLATRANETEYFFIPNGEIPDNTTTFLNNVDFYDDELVDSADYLFDLLAELPACLNITEYKSRMVLMGFPIPDNSLLRFSQAGSAESFDEIQGIKLINRDDQHSIKCGWEHGGLFYIAKSQGVYAIQDSEGLEPAEWDREISIDKGIGSYAHGVSEIPNFIAGQTKASVFLTDASGILLFDGSFHRPELTWKIHDIWLRINKTYFNKVQVYNDPINQFIYCNVPLYPSTEPSMVLYGDYSECGESPESQNIKWTVWKFPTNPISISVFDIEGKGNPIFRYGTTASGGIALYRMCLGNDAKSDNGTPIEAYIKTWLMAPAKSKNGQVNQFIYIRARAEGSGQLDITLYGEDNVTVNLPPYILISNDPGFEYQRLVNFINERVSIKIGVNALDEWFNLFRMVMYGKKYGEMRPMVQ